MDQGPSPAWHGGRGVRAKRFTGRTRDLWTLHSKLAASDMALITGRVGVSSDGTS